MLNDGIALLLKLSGVTVDPELLKWGTKAFTVIMILVDEEKREDELAVLIAELRNGVMPSFLNRVVLKDDEKVVVN